MTDLSNSCSVLKEMYRSIYTKQKSLQAKFRLPAIVVGSISGACSFGTTTFPQSYREYVSIAVGGASIFIAILSTIESYLQVGQRLSQAQSTSQALQKLMTDIRRELLLPVVDRETSGVVFVRDCYTRFQQIIEQSPSIDRDDIRNNYRMLKHNAVGIPDLLSISRLKLDQNSKPAIVASPTEHLGGDGPSNYHGSLSDGMGGDITPNDIKVAIDHQRRFGRHNDSGTSPLELLDEPSPPPRS